MILTDTVLLPPLLLLLLLHGSKLGVFTSTKHISPPTAFGAAVNFLVDTQKLHLSVNVNSIGNALRDRIAPNNVASLSRIKTACGVNVNETNMSPC